MQRLRVLWVFLQRLAIKHRRPIESPGLMVGEAGVHHRFAVIGCHDQRCQLSDRNQTLLLWRAMGTPSSPGCFWFHAPTETALLFGVGIFYTVSARQDRRPRRSNYGRAA